MDPAPHHRTVCGETCQRGLSSREITPNNKRTNNMKTTLTNTLAALSVALLVSFTLTSCESPRSSAGGGWHNMGVGPKDNHPMPDANMPSKR